MWTGLNVACHSSPTARKLSFYFLPFSCNQVNSFSESSQDIIKSSNQIIKSNHQIKSSKNHLHHVLCSYSGEKKKRKQKILFCARWKLNGFGHRSFSVQAPLVWNNLPPNIRHSSSLSQFKTSLKTFLFTSAFSELPWSPGRFLFLFVCFHGMLFSVLLILQWKGEGGRVSDGRRDGVREGDRRQREREGRGRESYVMYN